MGGISCLKTRLSASIHITDLVIFATYRLASDMKEPIQENKPRRGRPRKSFDLSNPEDIRSVCKRIYHASKTKEQMTPQDLEDVTMEIITRWLEGKSANQTIDYSVIDILRKTSGRKDARKPEVYEARKRISKPINLGEMNVDRLKNVPKTTPEYFEGKEFNRLVGMVSCSRRRAILKLQHKWGFKAVEIAELFDVSESCISHLVLQSHKEILKHIKSQGGADEFSQPDIAV